MSSNYLDVDSKILEKNLLLKNNSADADELEKFFRSPENYSKECAPWKLVTPSAGFCVKTTDVKKNKVFINVCKLDDIPEPKEITEDELRELWCSEDASDYRIPLSMQEPHDELDKSGRPTVAYDVAINTKFFDKIQSNTVFRSFVMQVILEGLENKYDLELKKEGFVILQNRKCLGELKPHRIRVNKGPYKPPKRLIEEMPSSSNSLALEMDGQDKRKNMVKSHQFRFFQNNRDKCVVGEFHLPNIVTSKDVTLDVGDQRIVLESRGGFSLVDLFIPVRVDAAKTAALFNANNRILTVKMPIVC